MPFWAGTGRRRPQEALSLRAGELATSGRVGRELGGTMLRRTW